MASAIAPGASVLELLAGLAEVAIQAHTLPTIVAAAERALSGHLPLQSLEIGRCDAPATAADTWVMVTGDPAPTRATRVLRGTLAQKAIASAAPQIQPIPSAAPLTAEWVRARDRGATTLAAVSLRAPTPEAAYALLALGPAREGQLELTPPLLEAIGRALSASLHQASTLARVASLSRRAHAERRELQGELNQIVLPPDVIARSPATRAIFHEMVPLVARTDTTVLILGESGTGKEVIARRIHALSPRANRPFLKVNCGALPEPLVESALFGHERGAFTGATQRHQGLFERAHGGTLLLDEIGDLSLSAQVKLLRVLQEGELERVGGHATLRVDVRVVAATHRDLEAMVAEERFRTDLYYRLDVFRVVVPPLRERAEDLYALVPAILDRLSARLGRAPPKVSEEALSKLRAHAWPGNVRELENVLERALLLSAGDALALPAALGSARPQRAAAPPAPRLSTYDEAARRCIADALAACDGKIYGSGGAARVLGLKPTTLQSKMKKLGM